jgi:glycosyltransferase involved in cell wall biosynthesis
MASRGKVLHVSENLTLPFDRRVWLELCALRDDGFAVSAICPTGEGHTERYEVRDDIHILRYPAPPATRGFLSYAWEFLYCWCQTAWLSLVVLTRRGFDIIHAANPPDTFWALALPYKLFGKRYVFDHHDLCPELYLARFGEDKEGNLLHRALGGLNGSVPHRGFVIDERVVSRSRDRRGRAGREGGVVRKGQSRQRFATVRQRPCKARARVPRLVPGVMAPQDGVDHLLRAARYLVHDRARGHQLTLMGAGDSRRSWKLAHDSTSIATSSSGGFRCGRRGGPRDLRRV